VRDQGYAARNLGIFDQPVDRATPALSYSTSAWTVSEDVEAIEGEEHCVTDPRPPK
jgi:hypothetical protein